MIVVRLQGGLGNQMFQYALYKSFKTKNRKTKLDISSFLYTDAHNGYELDKIFNLDIEYANQDELLEYTGVKNKDFRSVLLNHFYRSIQTKKFLKPIYYKDTTKIFFEKEHSYKPEIFQHKNIYLDGWWQNEMYFKDLSALIKKDFTFKLEENNGISLENLNLLNEITNSNSVSIHVRRGDYLNNTSLGQICDLKYYNKAIEIIKNKIDNPSFFIFSDDIEFCKKNIKLDKVQFIGHNLKKDSYVDMFLMSKCKHNIIANSSFSWWGSYLNGNREKLVIMPKRWYHDKESEINNIDCIKI